MTVGGTAAYEHLSDVPDLVARAVALAQEMGFDCSCRPEQGRLLQLLAAGRPGGRFGETGTGCGVGLAWMAAGARPNAQIFSVERDEGRAEAASRLFASHPNVTIINDDWTAILGRGPFDLLVLDGGGSGKTPDDRAIDPNEVLKPFGTIVIDDFTPLAIFPPEHDGRLDAARLHWLEHPELLSTEVVLCQEMSTIVALRRG